MINYESLEYTIYDILDERIIDEYDIGTILATAKEVWDNTAIQVTAKDFVLTVDNLTYEIVDYTGYDMGDD